MITYEKPYTATAHIHSLDGARAKLQFSVRIKQANSLTISWITTALNARLFLIGTTAPITQTIFTEL